MIDRARRFAAEAHGDQRYGDHPYVWHLDAVAQLAVAYGEEAVVLAYLHDVVEDTAVTVTEVNEYFGPLIAACVAVLTDEPGENRKARKAATHQKMAAVEGDAQLALLVKACDRLANITACVSDGNVDLLQVYRREQTAFRKAVYRKGLCDDVWENLEALVASR